MDVETEYFGLKLGQELGNREHTPTKNSEEYPPGFLNYRLLCFCRAVIITVGITGENRE